MPLWKAYADALDSDVAEIKNDPDGWAQAGSVTAALFLQRFAPKGPWARLVLWDHEGGDSFGLPVEVGDLRTAEQPAAGHRQPLGIVR